MSQNPHKAFLPYFLRGVAIVLAAAAITYWLHLHGAFDRWENDNLDFLLFSRQPTQSQQVVLVVIDEEDYQTRFSSQSPLKAEGVGAILEAIAKGSPKLVGVDLDTSNWTADQVTSVAALRPTVWARDGWFEKDQFHLAAAAGGDLPGIAFALPAMQVDEDGILRRFYHEYRPPGGAPLSGLPSVLARCAHGDPPKMPECASAEAPPPDRNEHEGNEKLIDFLGAHYSFRRLTAGSILKLAEIKEWRDNSDLDGKIVLLGGTYRAARDRYVTPVGAMDGVEVLAHAVQTELGGPLTEAGHSAYVWADVALGLSLIVTLYFVASGWTAAVLAASVVLPVLVSAALFHTTGYFFSFVPVVAGVGIHHVLEMHLEKEALERENENLLHEISELRAPAVDP